MSSQPPGWYPDAQGQQRYWDGNQWTEHVAPAAGGPATGGGPAAGATGQSSPLLIVALVLAAVTVVGNFLAWATFGDLSAAGIDGSDGKIVIGLIAVAIVALLASAFSGRRAGYVTAIIFGLLAAAVGVLNITDIQDKGLDLGPGIFMVTGGAVLFAVVCGMLMAQSRR
jgi:hypothetical protein